MMRPILCALGLFAALATAAPALAGNGHDSSSNQQHSNQEPPDPCRGLIGPARRHCVESHPHN
jgi:hypothetical protein